MKKIFRKELIIGVCVIAALLVLVFGIDYLKGVNVFKAANYYYATYTDVEGLAVSAPVTVNGFKIGLVRDISYEYDNPGHIKVEMSLDRQLRVPRGTRAVLTSDLLGTASIALEMGTSGDYHDVGDNLEGVVASGMMDNISNQLLPSVAALAPKLDSLVTSLNTLASDPALLASIRRLDAITANLEASSRALNVSIASLPPVMSNVNTLSANAASASARIDTLLATVNASPIDSTLYNLNETTRQLRILSAQLNDPNSSLGRLTTDDALYTSIAKTIMDVDSVVLDFKKQPRRYMPTLKIF